MKNTYPEYFTPSEDDFKGLWKDALFVFDANILLDLYLYSTDTVKNTFKTFEKIKDKIKIPHQVGLEFSKNRHNKIHDMISIYSKEIKFLEKLFKTEEPRRFKNDLLSREQPPFLDDSEELMKKIEDALKELSEKLDIRKKHYQDLLGSDDSILDQISALIEGNIENQYDEKKLNEIYTEGAKRATNNIPPGFNDLDKDGNDGYNDYVIWNQMIDISKNNNSNIIFVTNEKKDDWWAKYKDKIVGPHPQLRKEFKEKTNHDYYSYRLFQFLELTDHYLNIKTKKESIEEIKTVNSSSVGPTIPNLGISKKFLDEKESDERRRRVNEALHHLYPDKFPLIDESDTNYS